MTAPQTVREATSQLFDVAAILQLGINASTDLPSFKDDVTKEDLKTMAALPRALEVAYALLLDVIEFVDELKEQRHER